MTYKAPQVSGSAMAMMAAVAAFMAVPLFIPGAPVVGQGGAIAASPEARPPLAGFSAQQRAGIEQIVREYLLAHPEIIIEVSRELEKRQAVAQADSHAKLLVAKRAEIFRNPQDFVAGNPDGKVTVVEFSDYNCGWCKRSIGELQKLIDADKDVRVVIKEFPIFGEDSEFAARFYRALSVFLAHRVRRLTLQMSAGPDSASTEGPSSDELNEEVLDGVYLAGSRFQRLSKGVSSVEEKLQP